jgi:hypothetical protein
MHLKPPTNQPYNKSALPTLKLSKFNSIRMSESELSDAPPSASLPPDSELEQALRTQVRDALKAGKDDPPITVASMRKAAEKALGLEVGFFKKSERWKEESKRIVHEAFVCLTRMFWSFGAWELVC